VSNRASTVGLVLLLSVLFLASGPAVTIGTDWLWFRSVGFDAVFSKRLGVEAALGLGLGLFAFVLVYGNARLALRNCGPAASPIRDPDDNPVGQVLARVGADRILLAMALVIALLAGLSGASWWADALLALHGDTFGYAEPVFGRDASFYVFQLPLLLHLRAAVMTLLIASGAIVLGTYITRGAVNLELSESEGQLVAQGMSVGPAARRHVAAIAAASVVTLAIGFYLQRYTVLYEQGGLFAGPGYSQLHGTLPLLLVQAVCTLLAAAVVHLGIERLSAGWMILGTGMIVVPSGATSLYPNLVQRFAVEPNELSREGPQIVDHVEATRYAYDLDSIEDLTLPGDNTLTREDVDNNWATIQNVRLWDHDQLLTTFSQVQEIRTYYRFVSVDNDRYIIDGELRQTMLSPRELVSADLPDQARTWVNEHMTYTHGYGLALGPVNLVTPEGLPELFIKDLPPKVTYPDDLAIDRPELYFGEAADSWVVVGSDNPEFDFPAGDENKYTSYAGAAGIPLGLAERALFATRFGSSELVFTTEMSEGSRLLLYRNITDRVLNVAPFLVLDRDPYLVIDKGRLVWVLDGLTSTGRFPYAQRSGRYGNYVRNPVKVTVDAYDGIVRFFLTHPEEPIARAWNAAFPGLFEPAENLSESLRAHLRYPQDLFDLQSTMFAVYHMQDHQIFYNREDEWEVPRLSADQRREEMAPYYTVMTLPGEDKEEFILMRPFSPKNKPNLAAWMIARSDPPHYGELRAYKFPKEKLIYGPKMVAARINQDDEISAKISLWNQQGSKVEQGTLLVLPIEESLIYVQPLYLRAQSDSIPELKRVIVAYENRIAMRDTLEEGLEELFGPPPADPSIVMIPGGDTPAAPATPGVDAAQADPERAALIRYAASRYTAALAAQRAGDWASYGDEIEALGDALQSLGGSLGVQLEPLAGDTP
jgi:uncharacterized membrane protein (UPF0182 family)